MTDTPETPLDRTVRLALAAGRYRRERDEARAAIARCEALLPRRDVRLGLPVQIPAHALRRALETPGGAEAGR